MSSIVLFIFPWACLSKCSVRRAMLLSFISKSSKLATILRHCSMFRAFSSDDFFFLCPLLLSCPSHFLLRLLLPFFSFLVIYGGEHSGSSIFSFLIFVLLTVSEFKYFASSSSLLGEKYEEFSVDSVSVLQLADVFESFRTKCIADYKLDPAHYFSSPHFTYDAFLRFSGVKLDLLTDINQYFFLERGIRGGLSTVAKRYAKANHPNISGYDSSKPTVHILDLDANNLYGKAMQDYLPYGSFRWMTACELTEEQMMEIAPDADEGCFVECT